MPSDPVPSLFKQRSQHAGSKIAPHQGVLGSNIKKYIKEYSKNFSFRTIMLRCLKCNVSHCLVDLYQLCSNGGFGVQNGMPQRVLGSNHRMK